MSEAELTEAELEALRACPTYKWSPFWRKLEESGYLWIYDNAFSSEPTQARLTNKGRALVERLERER